jgi:hypothetical protein
MPHLFAETAGRAWELLDGKGRDYPESDEKR